MPRASSNPTTRERAKRRAYQQEQQAILREKYGISTRVRNSPVNKFPNLSVRQTIPLSNTIPGTGTVRKTGASHPDAKLFPIQQPHKQGYMLLTGFDPLETASGKKV